MALVILEVVWPVVSTRASHTRADNVSSQGRRTTLQSCQNCQRQVETGEESTAANKGARGVDRWPLGKRDLSVDGDSVTLPALRPAHSAIYRQTEGHQIKEHEKKT